MEIVPRKSFKKDYKKLPARQQVSVDEALLLFMDNPFHEELDNHALKGALKGLRSIDAENDLRIIFEEVSEGKYEIVELLNVGSHSKLY